MRNIGDTVWVPQAKSQPVWEQCPDCLGTARWHVVLPSGEEFDCECCRCYHGGFEPSNGKVCERHEVSAFAVQAIINGIEDRGEGIRYSTTAECGLSDADLFDDEAGALARSVVKAREWHDAEDARMHEHAKRKGRPRKTADGIRQANDMDFGGGSINYARSQVRQSIKEAFRWIAYAARHGAVIDIQDAIKKAVKP